MNIKTTLLVVIVFSLFLLTTIYFNPDTSHGHSHGQEGAITEETGQSNQTTHNTID
ncbi:MAG: hypothetical protein KAU21_04260 [Gammaproteobacteria bacterium]|nr:hypothetical protein [Gammaproteobacteria bacterium]